MWETSLATRWVTELGRMWERPSASPWGLPKATQAWSRTRAGESPSRPRPAPTRRSLPGGIAAQPPQQVRARLLDVFRGLSASGSAGPLRHPRCDRLCEEALLAGQLLFVLVPPIGAPVHFRWEGSRSSTMRRVLVRLDLDLDPEPGLDVDLNLLGMATPQRVRMRPPKAGCAAACSSITESLTASIEGPTLRGALCASGLAVSEVGSRGSQLHQPDSLGSYSLPRRVAGRDRDSWTDGQTDRQTGRQTDRQTAPHCRCDPAAVPVLEEFTRRSPNPTLVSVRQHNGCDLVGVTPGRNRPHTQILCSPNPPPTPRREARGSTKEKIVPTLFRGSRLARTRNGPRGEFSAGIPDHATARSLGKGRKESHVPCRPAARCGGPRRGFRRRRTGTIHG